MLFRFLYIPVIYYQHLQQQRARARHTWESEREGERVQSCCTCTTNNKANFVWFFGSLQGCQHAHTHARMKHIREMSMCVCLCVCVCVCVWTMLKNQFHLKRGEDRYTAVVARERQMKKMAVTENEERAGWGNITISRQ